MASAPASDGGRPRVLRRVVRRLVGRLLTDRLPVRRSGADGASAGLVGTLPVRRPWSLMRWWYRMFGRSPIALPGHAAATASPGERPVGATPAITARRPMLSAHSPARRGVALRSPLAGATFTGPDVRPGHDLRMPAGRAETAAAGVRRLRPGAAAQRGRAVPGHAGPWLPGPGIGAVTVRPGLAESFTVVGGGPARTLGTAPGGAHTPIGGTTSVGGTTLTGSGGLPGRGAPAGEGGLVAGIVRTGAAVIADQRRVGRPPFVQPAGTASTTRAGAARIGHGHGNAALAGRPAPGPAVHNPQPVGYLRVLGAATLPPGSEPDPMGAVTFGPAAAPRPRHGSHPGLSGGHAGSPVPERVSPRARWEAAVAARPLESPRPLPTAFHAMASAITGRARPPLFTTGPATRHALAAAGALGATTGTVVHLPAPPKQGPSVSAVLAHELTHTRNPVRRPRFFLGGASSLLDDDERSALAAGRDRLSGAGGPIGQARTALGDAASTAAGIVDQLPVGGGLGAVGEVATRAARAAVMEAAASPLAVASGLADDARGASTGAVDAASGALSGASGLGQQAAESVGGIAAQASSAVSGAVSNATGAAATAKAALDPDRVVEIVEQRLLREIERRGGRWAGMF